jgi:Tol biopolymer transport system component
VLIEERNDQFSAVFSPNGRWIAYTSNEGPTEIIVRPYPNVEGGRWQISSGGGAAPRWSADGRELFYLDITGSGGSTAPRALMAVSIADKAGFEYGTPRVVAKWPAGTSRYYDVAPDGRFLIVVPVGDGTAVPVTRFVVVQNWSQELQRLVPSR